MKLGLRAQLLLALVVVTFGAIASVGAIAILETRQEIGVDRVGRAAAWAEAVARSVELAADPAVAIEDPTNRVRVARILPLVGRATEASEIVVYDARGHAVSPATPTPLPTDGMGLAAAAAGAPAHAQERAAEGRLVLVAYAAVQSGTARGCVRVTFPIEDTVDALLGRARTSVLLLGAADALLLLLVGAWMLRGVVVRPVLALEGAARRVAAGDLEARVALRGPGELGLLADAFDRMTASLKTGRESLIRSEKLAGIGRLAAGVAHEVGNPLAAILGYVETLLSDSPARPIEPELRTDVLERIRAETERIHKTLSELLEYARPGDEGVEPVDVARVVAGAISLVRAQARGRNVTVATELAADLPTVQAVPGRLTQVLVNLLLNAADATTGEGRITVEARRGDAGVIISVADDGPGVPAEIRSRLFEPFFTTKEVGKGTGLGLSVSLAIVERWGGTIRLAESARGARFEISMAAAGPAGGQDYLSATTKAKNVT